MTWRIFGYDPGTSVTTALIFTVLSCLNYLLSDALVVWRAWVMWPGNNFVRGLLSGCMVLGLAGTIFEIVSQSAMASEHIVLGLPLTTMAVTLCLTNVVSTALIDHPLRPKIMSTFRMYRRDVSKLLAPNSTGMVGGVLLLLLESGVVYAVLWAINVFVQVSEKIEGHPHVAGHFEMMHETFYLCAGIYPTFVVVIVTLQQSMNEDSAQGQPSTFLESLHFALECDERRLDYDERRWESTTNFELEEPLCDQNYIVRGTPTTSGTTTTAYSEEIELAPRRTQAAEGRKD
ncbi:hypothetical protein EV122DRAFT_252983 [Schizophyllum commune]